MDDDDFMKEDETSDFTLFEVNIFNISIFSKLISLFQVSDSKEDTTLIDNSSQNFASTTYNFDDWGKF